MGFSFSLCLVCTPILTSPALMPCVSEWGIGTRNDATPRINTISPIRNKPFIERHAPHLLAGFVQRLAETLIHFFVIGEDTSVHVPQGNYNGTSECGSINQMSASQLAGVEQAVGEDETSFRIGVDNLD